MDHDFSTTILTILLKSPRKPPPQRFKSENIDYSTINFRFILQLFKFTDHIYTQKSGHWTAGSFAGINFRDFMFLLSSGVILCFWPIAKINSREN